MVLYFLDGNSSLTLATCLVCGTGQFQRVALLRKMKTGKGTSHLIAWWSGWRSMKTLMGTFVSLKHMLIFLASSLPTSWEASSINEKCWLNGCGTHGEAVQA
jgi:hypothetical protein